jgi:hypothetical protein
VDGWDVERLGVERQPVGRRQLGNDGVDKQVVVGRELVEQIVVGQELVEPLVVGRQLVEPVVVKQVVVEQELVGRRLGRHLDAALCPPRESDVSISSPSS